MYKHRRKRRKVLRNSSVAAATEASSCKDEESKSIGKDSFLNDLKSVITKVQNLTWTPPVYVYNIQCKDSTVSVADMNEDRSVIVCAFENASKIYVKIQAEEKLSQIEDENLLLNYNTLKVAEVAYNKIPAHLSSDRYLTGHSLPVTGLKFIKNRKLLLSCSLDKTVKAWSTENFVEVKSFVGMEFFYDIDVSCNSTRFAASGVKGAVSLYSFGRRVPEMTFFGHTDDVNCVRFHPNGIYFATASADKTIKLWSTRTGKSPRVFQDDKIPTALAFSPNGLHLASYSAGVIKIWDLASGKLLALFHDPPDESTFSSLCFSEVGGVLASGGQKLLKVWDVKNLKSPADLSERLRPRKTKSCLLEKHSLSKIIKLIKFDENNCITCVTS